jgi:mRNA deadenylase 3'-5' endonuclease subunit Ccr4
VFAGEPKTNWTHNFQGCLDYIFYTGPLQSLALRDLPQQKDIEKHVGFPSQHWPSDHVAIGSTFIAAAPAATSASAAAASPQTTSASASKK